MKSGAAGVVSHRPFSTWCGHLHHPSGTKANGRPRAGFVQVYCRIITWPAVHDLIFLETSHISRSDDGTVTGCQCTCRSAPLRSFGPTAPGRVPRPSPICVRHSRDSPQIYTCVPSQLILYSILLPGLSIEKATSDGRLFSR